MKNWTIPLFFGLIMFFLQALIYLAGVQLKPGELADTDCYMRMVRVEKLAQTHQWFDHSFERSNAPYGESSHWGRLMDILILGLALPFRFFFPLHKALFCSGILISPLLLVFCGFAVAWAARPLGRKIELPHLLLLFFSQASVVLFFQAGRPDHHSLLLLLFVLSLGFLFRLLAKNAGIGTALGCAAVHAIAFSVSLESITTLVFSLGVLSMAWMAGQLRAKLAMAFSAGLLFFCLVFYALEQPWQTWAAVELDRMTLPHLMALSLAAFFWFALWQLEGQAMGQFLNHGNAKSLLARKAGLTLVYGILALALLIWVFPSLLRGPYGQMDPRLNELWLKNVLEVQSLWQTEPGGLTTLFIWLSPALIVFPVCLLYLSRKSLPNAYKTWPWLTAMLASTLFTFLTLYQIRWSSYAQAALVFPFCAVLGEVLLKSERTCSPQIFRWARLGLLLFFCAGYVPVALLTLGPKILAAKQASPVAGTAANDSLLSLAHWLETEPGFGPKERILAHLDLGPELVYRTRHEVIATPYHRNGSGILFLYDLMNETSDEAVLLKLRERSVSLILLNPDSSEKAFLTQSGQTGTFYQRLLEGQVPNFLQAIELPAENRQSFRLYRVKGNP